MESFDQGIARSEFPELERVLPNGKRVVYLDNAATSLMPVQVAEFLKDFYLTHKANVHRGSHFLSNEATDMYEQSRQVVARFINADAEEIAFVKNATEALNIAAFGLKRVGFENVLLSIMEHHSNIVPWQLHGFALHYVGLKGFELNLSTFDELLEKIEEMSMNDKGVVAITHVSNVLGVINPVEKLFARAKRKGFVTVLDCAQSAPHLKLDVKSLKADIIAFSGHKMLGPSVGVLYCNKKLDLQPLLGGGSMIKLVTKNKSEWNDKPLRFEAGTPPIAEAIALSKAIEFLKNIGLQNIHKHDKELTKHAIDSLSSIKGLNLLLSKNNYSSIVSFELQSKLNIHAHDVAEFLSSKGICIRAGHHCAMPLHEYLKIPATARASFYFYNNVEDVNALTQALKQCVKFFKH
ncbi:cysteine desulfurase [Candidatus Woesearchaeota archaeon]|nr:cysteine desulfurase [Candidatus Woesearchaeota archaeon]